MIEIFVDADACPVKDEVYVVATRYGVRAVLVANAPMYVPRELGAVLVVVGNAPDEADDFIAAHVRRGDVVVTSDIPLAARCLPVGARVLSPDGRPFSEESIGDALASRNLNSELRTMGVLQGGPRPLAARDRSRFASRLDQMVRDELRDAGC